MSADAPARLYILAFDHRGSFEKGIFGIEGKPTDEQCALISDAKRAIFEGFQSALAEGAPSDAAGILVDEEFGADIARAAKAKDVILAMPVEKSGEDEFQFQYGDDFGSHIEAFDPRFTKVLVRYNPEGDRELNQRQAATLRILSDWLHQHRRSFLFELLVPATVEELEDAGSADRFDHGQRPDLVIRAISELQQAGVEPDIWKIEGIDTREDCGRVATQARSSGRDNVRCIVLGRGADEKRVEEWLRVAAGADGFVGFAIGRTIWWDALKAMRAGDITRQEAAARIGASYRRAIDVYREAAGA